MLAPWIDERAVRPTLGGRREMGASHVVHPEDVEDRLSFADQVIRDDAPMAPPPEGLGAHDRAAPFPAQLAQLDETSAELLAHGVVGIVVKALIRPESIHGRWDAYLPSPETSESGDVLIADRSHRQRIGERLLVELRIRARARNGPDVGYQFHLGGGQHIDELGNRSGGVADREERK